MSNQKTNLDKIKEKSKVLFDAVSFEDANDCMDDFLKGLFISHPYTNSPIVVNPKDNTFVNLVEDKNAQIIFRNFIFKEIDKSEDCFHILFLLNKPYYLYWFKTIRHYLSQEDYAKILKEVWTLSENPNMDVNVPVEISLEFFINCNMNYLMDEKEKEFYNDLPNNLTLYRGVSKDRNPYGLSYTTNFDKAEWFSKRFTKTEDYIITLEVKKEDCLCYINSRDEQEIVLNVKKYYQQITKQIPRNEL